MKTNKFWIEVKKLFRKWTKITGEDDMETFVHSLLNYFLIDSDRDINDEFFELCEQYGVEIYEDDHKGKLLQLSDRHVLWEVDSPSGVSEDEFEDVCRDLIDFGLDEFKKSHDNIDVGLYGRMGRHVCIPFTEYNLEHYFELRNDLDECIDETINSINDALLELSEEKKGVKESRQHRGCMLKEYVSRYVVYANGSEWISTEAFEDAKAIADRLIAKYDDVEVVAEPGRVHVYGTNKNESSRLRGRMLRESEDISKATVTAMWTGKVIAYENVLKLIGKYEGEDLYRKVKTLADDARSELENI